jgi:antimicrobial peptide system SdpA family protein
MFLLAIAWGACALYGLHSVFPHNPVSLPGEEALQLPRWLPEGWGFFTRDPRASDPLPYREEAPGRWTVLQSRAGPSFLGLGRSSRAQGFELNALLSQLSGATWLACQDAPARCVAKANASLAAGNPAVSPTICGSVAFVMQEPIPWAWRSSQAVMPSTFIRVAVKC